jgi:hypothetical protein
MSGLSRKGHKKLHQWQAIAKADEERFRHLWHPENAPAPNTSTQQVLPLTEAHRDS